MNLFRQENKERKRQENELRDVVIPAFKKFQIELGWLCTPQLNTTPDGIKPVNSWRPLTDEEKNAGLKWLEEHNVGNKEMPEVLSGNGKTTD